ncbi:MAG: hypothetical protein HOV79_17645 [Hamadaea sp.]|nr:hypothetical protein [Hamadaea sp.]
MSTYEPHTAERHWLNSLLGYAVLLVIVVCGVGLWLGVPVAQQYPAKISTPAQVLGNNRVTDPSLETDTAQLRDSLRKYPLMSNATAAYYMDEKKPELVFVLAVSGFLLMPERDLDTILHELDDGMEAVGELTDVDAGDLGGSAKCAYFRFEGMGTARGTLCGWADHGSLGVVLILPVRDRDEGARKMLDVRFAVETR